MRNKSVDELIQELKIIRIQETQILNQHEEARTRETSDRSPNPFKEGDHIKVTNNVRLPRGRTVTDGDRLAVVTDIQGDKVYFTTSNGTKTWRLRKNIVPNGSN